MDVAYLSTTQPGLRWMRDYYGRRSELDLRRAAVALRTAATVLREHPTAGRRFEDIEAVREHPIQGTPFSLLYTIARDAVWVIDVRDQLGQRSASALRHFLREFRVQEIRRRMNAPRRL